MNRTDLKIYQSARMTQQPDAGGQRSSNEVISGRLNDVFSNISAIDYAQSALDIVKVFPAVSTNSTELLQDAHIFISAPPVDPLVDVLMIESAQINDGSTRNDVMAAVQQSVIKGQLLRSGLAAMVAGQDTFSPGDLFRPDAPTGESTEIFLTVGQQLAICVEYSGAASAQWPRLEHFCKVVSLSPMRFEPGLPIATPARATVINGQTHCTVLRNVLNSSAIKLHGVSHLSAQATSNMLQVAKTSAALIPSIQQFMPRTGNQPFLTSAGLQKKQLQLPATGLVYSLLLSDSLDGMVDVNYISAGQRRTDVNRNWNGQQFEFVLNAQPDAGSVITLSYVSSQRYKNYNSAVAFPANHRVVFQTVKASMLNNGTRYSGHSVIGEDGVIRLSTTGSAYDYRQAAILSADGTVVYFNGFSAINYTAVLEDLAAAGEQTNTAQFALPYSKFITASLYITAQTVAGQLVSASADLNGQISGAGVTGTIENSVVSLTFSAQIRLSSIRYNVDELVALSPPTEQFGINPMRLPADGQFALFRRFGVIAVSHDQVSNKASLTTGETIAARADSWIDITDSTGASLWHPLDSHFSYNKTNGQITINSVTGFVAPFRIIDTITEMALVTAVADKKLTLARPLNYQFPIGSVVSSVQVLGNLQATATAFFDMASFSGAWLDEPDTSAASASYNQLQYPLVLKNASAINERWCLIFTSTTAFRVVGEQTGQIALGDTLNDLAPLNPNTGQPYFVLRASGWGSGWAPGECLRFNTVAASRPAVLARVVSAGHSTQQQDSIRLHFRGNAH